MRSLLFESEGEYVMSAVDLAELRSDGFAVTPPPDEADRIVDTATLPRAVAQRVVASGIDMPRAVRMIGEITASSTSGLGRYVIRFVEA
jgi:hypothetical protein